MILSLALTIMGPLYQLMFLPTLLYVNAPGRSLCPIKLDHMWVLCLAEHFNLILEALNYCRGRAFASADVPFKLLDCYRLCREEDRNEHDQP